MPKKAMKTEAVKRIEKQVDTIVDRVQRAKGKPTTGELFNETARTQCRLAHREGKRRIEINGRMFRITRHRSNPSYFLVKPVKGQVPLACLSRI